MKTTMLSKRTESPNPCPKKCQGYSRPASTPATSPVDDRRAPMKAASRLVVVWLGECFRRFSYFQPNTWHTTQGLFHDSSSTSPVSCGSFTPHMSPRMSHVPFDATPASTFTCQPNQSARPGRAQQQPHDFPPNSNLLHCRRRINMCMFSIRCGFGCLACPIGSSPVGVEPCMR